VGTQAARKRWLTRRERGDRLRSGECTPELLRTHCWLESANPYRGPVVILLDEECASESEEMAAGLQAIGRAVVIGRTSRGEDMDATIQGLPMASLLLEYPVGLPRTPKGVAIEGHGVIPDLDVKLTRDELLKGKDSQLEAAIRHMRRSAQ
jgi:C-terminal processing protease CtpA/Prc